MKRWHSWLMRAFAARREISAAAAMATTALAPVALRGDEETREARHESAIRRLVEITGYQRSYFENIPRGQILYIEQQDNVNCDADLMLFGEMRGVTVTVIQGLEGITNAGLAFLAAWKELESLEVWDMKSSDLTEDWLEYVEHLPKLKHIGIDVIWEHGSASLVKIKSLESVLIGQSEIPPNLFENLAQLPHLFELTFGIRFKGRAKTYDFAALSKLTELEELTINGAKIRRKDLAHLKNLKHLHTLSLDGATMAPTGEELEPLAELPRLRELDLTDANVTDEDMAAIGKCSRLEKLVLNGCNIGDKGLAQLLDGAFRLKELEISGTHVTDEGVKLLEKEIYLEKALVDPKVISAAAIAHWEESKRGRLIIRKESYRDGGFYWGDKP